MSKAPAWFYPFFLTLLGCAIFAGQLVALRHAHRADLVAEAVR